MKSKAEVLQQSFKLQLTQKILQILQKRSPSDRRAKTVFFNIPSFRIGANALMHWNDQLVAYNTCYKVSRLG